MSYRLAPRGVIRIADDLHITRDMVEWQTYRAWLKAGNTPLPEVVIQKPRWPSLNAAKLDVWTHAKAKRDTREAAGFEYLGKTLDSDPRAVLRINTASFAAQAALTTGSAFQIKWTCADSTVLTLDATEMLGMPVALAAHANTLHVEARVFKARILWPPTPSRSCWTSSMT